MTPCVAADGAQDGDVVIEAGSIIGVYRGHMMFTEEYRSVFAC